jgi:hypothetical protein
MTMGAIEPSAEYSGKDAATGLGRAGSELHQALAVERSWDVRDRAAGELDKRRQHIQ